MFVVVMVWWEAVMCGVLYFWGCGGRQKLQRKIRKACHLMSRHYCVRIVTAEVAAKKLGRRT